MFTRHMEVVRTLHIGEKDYLGYFQAYFARSVSQRLGVVAVDGASTKMVGGAIGDDFNNASPAGITKLAGANEGMRTLTKLRKEMEAAFRSHLDSATNKRKGAILLLKTGAVLPDYMGKDVGTHLANYVCELAQRRGYEMATCRATGNASIRLYEKLG